MAFIERVKFLRTVNIILMKLKNVRGFLMLIISSISYLNFVSCTTPPLLSLTTITAFFSPYAEPGIETGKICLLSSLDIYSDDSE